MQFVSIPILTFVRPTYTFPSSLQIMTMALCADFKKFVLDRASNEFYQSQKDDRKSQNTDTNHSTISLEDIFQRKNEQKEANQEQKNRKSTRFSQNLIQINEENAKNQQKKRLSFQKARLQITQALQQSQEINEEEESEITYKKEQQVIQKNDSQSVIKEQIQKIEKQKKIKKQPRIQKIQKVSNIQVPLGISVQVSLIDTTQNPRIEICRLQLQKKRQNLLSRIVSLDELDIKKYNYHIRQRKELKKLN